MNKNIIPLKNAGYREKVFIKSLLAEQGGGRIDEWESWLRGAIYNTRTDTIDNIKVTREGTESLRILKILGFDDKDCF